MKYRLAAKFVALMLVCLALVGCAAPYTYYCDDSCGGPSALSGRYGAGSVEGCDDCDVAVSAPCDGGCGASCTSCAGAGPFCGHTLTGLLRSMVTCNAGCSDLYWGEWSHDPPDACDPCNNHGDFVGGQCCGPSCWERFWEGVHGARHCPVGCTSGCNACCDTARPPRPGCGCDDCGASSTHFSDEQYESLETIEQPEAVPTPQPQDAAAELSRGNSRPYYSRDPNSRLVRRPAR